MLLIHFDFRVRNLLYGELSLTFRLSRCLVVVVPYYRIRYTEIKAGVYIGQLTS